MANTNNKLIKKKIQKGQKPTAEQIREIQLAAAKPIEPDNEAPELTVNQYREMAEIAKAERLKSKKPVVAIRISPDTLARAKATGKGYTGFLSRLLDNAIKDPDMVAKSI